MYLGHLLFMLGLALTFASWFALVLFAARAVWFHRRVLEDEARLQGMFGARYLDYQRRGEGWVPGLLCRAVSGEGPTGDPETPRRTGCSRVGRSSFLPPLLVVASA